MCGIFSIFLNINNNNNNNNNSDNSDNNQQYYFKYGTRKESLRELAYRQSGKQRHRGPDHSGLITDNEHGVAIMQERLSVLCVRTGSQPFVSSDEQIILAANGEIYNYLQLTEMCNKKTGKNYVPRSDCDAIIPMYQQFGVGKLMQELRGMYAFVLYDKKTKNILVARDPIGIIPLYMGEDADGNIWFASEMKCLVEKCPKIKVFPPGHYCYGTRLKLFPKPFYTPLWMSVVPDQHVELDMVRELLEAAVLSHLQCDVPFGALLSGGVDSSLIAAIATRVMRQRYPYYKLKTYSVGLKDAPDFKYSQMVADYIDSDHTEVHFTIEEGLDCIRDIVYHTETYDVTTVRCSIPMFILTRFIKSEGIKMVLSGEGADEVFGGYLYFHKAPSADDFHEETVSRVKNLHLSDCLRANKSTSAWGIELRVPFLDTDFVDYCMGIRPEDRMPQTVVNGQTKQLEKYILRAAFANKYLPNQVLWRQKEQFSDGVGYAWIDTIIEYASSHVTDEMFAEAEKEFPINTPKTKEAYYYRQIFDEMFPHKSCASTVKRWIPRTDWGCSADPSGRAQGVHLNGK
uniref:Asparagine synthetase [glutamine-hydrolyzing] n=1 Tax=Corethrella appendiculata TaxID=1370023 RepID=U5EYS6_9DIPT